MHDAIERVTEIKWLYICARVFILVGIVVLILDEWRNLGGRGIFYIVSIWGVVFILQLIYVVLKPSVLMRVGNWGKRQIQKQLSKFKAYDFELMATTILFRLLAVSSPKKSQ